MGHDVRREGRAFGTAQLRLWRHLRDDPVPFGARVIAHRIGGMAGGATTEINLPAIWFRRTCRHARSVGGRLRRGRFARRHHGTGEGSCREKDQGRLHWIPNPAQIKSGCPRSCGAGNRARRSPSFPKARPRSANDRRRAGRSWGRDKRPCLHRISTLHIRPRQNLPHRP